MCFTCGEKYGQESNKLKKELSLKYGVAEQEPNHKLKLNREFMAIKNAIIVYKEKAAVIPQESLMNIKKNLQKIFSEIIVNTDLTEEGKKKLLSLNFDKETGLVVIDEKFEDLFVNEYNPKIMISKFGGNKLKQNLNGKLVVKKLLRK